MRLILVAVLLSICSAAESRWIVMRSENFEVYSSAGERATRETLRHFEQVRGFFAQTNLGLANPEFLIRVVVFSSKKEFEEVRPTEFASAFYSPGRLREYIVMGNTAREVFPVAVHEYVHLLARQSGLRLPPWLNEGLAELYSTLEPRAGKILVGNIIQGRWQALTQDKWVPLETILSADRDSPYYNEKKKAGSLYNEGWALTHMLMLSGEYRPGAAKAMAMIQAGTPSAEALTRAYGKPLALIERELQGYVRQDRLQGVLFDAKLEKIRGKLEGEPASEFDVRLILAELGSKRRSKAENRELYTRLRDEEAGRPEPHALLGYLDWGEGQHAAAAGNFTKAYELGERNPQFLWDAGRLTQASAPKVSIAALQELSRAQPERVEVRVELAFSQLLAGEAKEALTTIAPVRKARPSEAVRLFEVIAYVNERNGNLEEARGAAARMGEFAKEPRERERAERLNSQLARAAPDSGRQGAEKPATIIASGQETLAERPPIRRAEAAEPPKEEIEELPPALPQIKGMLVGMNCSAKPPSLTVESEGKTHSLLLDKPGEVVLTGLKSGKIDLPCGPTRPRPVLISYESPGPNHPRAAGLVRFIEFLEE